MDRRPPDPFAIQADPSLYVPRRATEEVLDELERSLASAPHGAVCFTGPPGIGKSLLLRVLAVELAERYRTAYLPYARLPAGGLWMCVATELGLEAGRDPKRAVRRLLAELAAERRDLLLEVDDASSLPAETLYDLLAFARSEANLRVLLTYSEGESLPGPVPEDLAVVRLEVPMSRAETQDYVKARLAASSAPRSLAERFDSTTVARLHRDSAGNPLRLHGLAVAVARGATPSGAPVTALAPEAPRRAERLPEPAAVAPAPPERPPVRPRRRPAAALVGPAWAIAGICVGLAASFFAGGWQVERGTEAAPVELTERTEPPKAATDAAPPAPPVAKASPSPSPSAEVAAPLPPAAAPPPSPEALPPVSAPPPAQQRRAPAPAPEPEIAAAPPPETAPAVAAPQEGSPPEAAPPAAEAAPRAPEPAAARTPSPPPVSAPAPAAEVAPRASAPAAAAPAPRPPREAELAPGRLDIGSEAQVEIQIEIDGRHYGPPPLVGVRLSRGEHRVIAHYADGGAGLKTIYLGDADVSITFR